METRGDASAPADGGGRAEDRRSIVEKVLDSPFAGLSPWILLSFLAGPGRLEESALLALGLSIVLVVASHLRGQTLKFLELSDTVCFAALAVVTYVASPSLVSWLEDWVGELSNLAVMVIALASLAIRRPFTLQYAREMTPEEDWDTPLFLSINYAITWVWAAAFVVSAAAGMFGNLVLENNNNLWTGWIIQTGALVVAGQFTAWYPDHAEAMARRRAGEVVDDPAPLVDLWVPLAGWMVPVGVISLVADGGPWWVGVGFIVAGSALTGQLKKMGEREPTAAPAAAADPAG